MMFLGFSDILPTTIMGRCVSVVASVFGLIYLSMIISAVTNLIAFTPDEQLLVRTLDSVPHSEQLQSAAARLIISW
jgi:hypothetical protein